MTRNQRLLLISIGIFVLLSILAVVGYLLLPHQPTQEKKNDGDPHYITYTPLKIDFGSYPDLQDTDKTAITSGLQAYVDKTGSTSGITGSIRDGSYKKSAEGTVITIQFLIDIPSVKRTYKINIGRDSSTGENSLYILCPDTNELKYGTFDCVDDVTRKE
ncbi:MAG TPA: hypothetical protein VJ841_04220 [Candidatus Saccharimonadales bacterium]|nr:hypothetical protein [Candidatus Saccharimonadales bacterium]